MPKLRVGLADTLDARPLAWGFLKGHHADLFESLSHPPHRIGRLLEQGGVDVALCPAIEAARVEGIRVLPDLCVSYGADGRGVLLVSPSPPAGVRRIVGGGMEPTAAAAAAVLLAELHGTPVEGHDLDGRTNGGRRGEDERFGALAPDEALLVTGAWRPPEAAHVLDVTAAWHELTGTPLVLDLWTVRGDVTIPGLPFYFKSSLRYGLSSLGAIAREAASERATDSGRLEAHLRGSVGYFLRDAERKGLEELFRRAAEHGLATAGAVRWFC